MSTCKKTHITSQELERRLQNMQDSIMNRIDDMFGEFKTELLQEIKQHSDPVYNKIKDLEMKLSNFKDEVTAKLNSLEKSIQECEEKTEAMNNIQEQRGRDHNVILRNLRIPPSLQKSREQTRYIYQTIIRPILQFEMPHAPEEHFGVIDIGHPLPLQKNENVPAYHLRLSSKTYVQVIMANKRKFFNKNSDLRNISISPDLTKINRSKISRIMKNHFVHRVWYAGSHFKVILQNKKMYKLNHKESVEELLQKIPEEELIPKN